MNILRLGSICLFLWCLGCDNQASQTNKPQNQSDLKIAHQFYQTKQFKEAAIFFQKHAKRIVNDLQKEAEYQEAWLGRVVCLLLSNDPLWHTELKSARFGSRWFWRGLSYDFLENLSQLHQEYFKGYTKAADFPQEEFVVLHFLLQYKHWQHITEVIAKYIHPRLSWDFCILQAWQHLKQSNFAEAKAIFELCSNATTQIQHWEALYGLGLIAILENPQQIPSISLPPEPQYVLELRTIPLFRASSPLTMHQKLLEENTDDWQPILLSDLLFRFGAISNQQIFVWKQGSLFLETLQQMGNPHLSPVYQTLNHRIQSSIAWHYFTRGEFEFAKAIFAQFKTQPWQQEAHLGLALLNWKQGQHTSELLQSLENVEIDWDYWLSGHKIAFFRLENRRQSMDEIQTLGQKKQLRFAFILLDTLCLLGDGRSAHAFLGDVLELVPKTQQQFYLLEQANIPQDIYAENRIEEKLD